MENQIQVSNHNLSTQELNTKESEIAKVIWHVNQLASFPLNDNQIESWARSVNELRPNQDVVKLRQIIDMMKIGEIEFNSRLGIQNIFSALKEYDAVNIGYIMRDKNHYNYKPDEDAFERIDYYEGQNYPKEMIWLVDKDLYERSHLKPTIPKSNSTFCH